jgi:hypothetical protein
MKCLSSGAITIMQMYTCSGSVVTPELLRSCIKDGVCEVNLSALAAAQYLAAQNLSWNSPLTVEPESPDLNALKACQAAHTNDEKGFTDCALHAAVGNNPVVACGDKTGDDRALAQCLLQAAGLNVSQLDCLLKREQTGPGACVNTVASPQWADAQKCLAKFTEPFKAVDSCLSNGSDPVLRKSRRA